jgi:insertion element IS1 protein InsB
MIIQVLHCPYCHEIDIVKHGLSPEGEQRYRCRTCLEGRGRTFLLDYSYAGQSPEVKQQIVDMAMNASRSRDTTRVLHVSPTTVINELKKSAAAAAGESWRVGVLESRASRSGHPACGCA